MKPDLRERLLEHCESMGAPLASAPSCLTDSMRDYEHLLTVASGFITRNGFFRFFGSSPFNGLPSRADWQASDGIRAYGKWLEDIWIIAEDIFGDQYGFERGTNPARLVKVFCEGAAREYYEHVDLSDFLLGEVLVEMPSAFDFDLAMAACTYGLQPALNEHLAFKIPLICGGEYDVANLGVESIALHLGLLGQMTQTNNALLDGESIQGFLDQSPSAD